MPHGLRHGDEGAGFVEVVDCFAAPSAWSGLLSQARVSPSQPKGVKPQPSASRLPGDASSERWSISGCAAPAGRRRSRR